MLDFTAENSGNRVVINTAPFRDVVALKNALLREFKNYPLGIKLVTVLNSKSTKDTIKEILDKELDFTSIIDFIKDVLISSETSEDLTAQIFNCLKYCTYNTAYKIDYNLFDEVKEARADYYEIIFACIKENLSPFIKSLVSTLSKYLDLTAFSQVLNVEQAPKSK